MTQTSEIQLKPVESQADVWRIRAGRAACGMPAALAPTHYFERDGQVVAYASLDSIPILTGWASDAMTDEEADACIEQMEREARERGLRFVLSPCTDDCRFLNRMKELGYRKEKQVTLFIKPL